MGQLRPNFTSFTKNPGTALAYSHITRNLVLLTAFHYLHNKYSRAPYIQTKTILSLISIRFTEWKEFKLLCAQHTERIKKITDLYMFFSKLKYVQDDLINLSVSRTHTT